MQTSARNQLKGRVEQVLHGPVNAEVCIALDGGGRMVSVITDVSARSLGLEAGSEVTALVKASSVILMAGSEEAKTSARNSLCGSVGACVEGAVNGEVTLLLDGGGEITAIVTNESIRYLGLGVGKRACALIKASNVILAVG